MSSLRTLHDRILVRPKKAQTKTDGGIEIAGTSTEKIIEGTVVQAGAGRMLNGKLVPLLVKPGDNIYFQGARPIEVELDGETLYVMSEGEVLAILEDSEVCKHLNTETVFSDTSLWGYIHCIDCSEVLGVE